MLKTTVETLDAAFDEIERLEGELDELRGDLEATKEELSASEGEISQLNGELEELRGGHALEPAAQAVMDEVVRPVGSLGSMTLPDTPAARRALLALHDALGLTP